MQYSVYHNSHNASVSAGVLIPFQIILMYMSVVSDALWELAYMLGAQLPCGHYCNTCKFPLNADYNASGRCLLKCSWHIFCTLFPACQMPIFRAY